MYKWYQSSTMASGRALGVGRCTPVSIHYISFITYIRVICLSIRILYDYHRITPASHVSPLIIKS